MFVSIANSSSENSVDEGCGHRISHYNPISIVGDSSIVGKGQVKDQVKHNQSSSANTNHDSYDINNSKQNNQIVETCRRMILNSQFQSKNEANSTLQLSKHHHNYDHDFNDTTTEGLLILQNQMTTNGGNAPQVYETADFYPQQQHSLFVRTLMTTNQTEYQPG